VAGNGSDELNLIAPEYRFWNRRLSHSERSHLRYVTASALSLSGKVVNVLRKKNSKVDIQAIKLR